MLKRIIAAALVLVASFSVSAQWRFEEGKDAMTDKPTRAISVFTDDDLSIIMVKRSENSVRIIAGRGRTSLWTPAIEGALEIRVDDNPVSITKYGRKETEFFASLPSIAALAPIRDNNFLSVHVGSGLLSQMANGKTMKIRFDTFTRNWVGAGSSPPSWPNMVSKTGTTKMSMPMTITTAITPTAIG